MPRLPPPSAPLEQERDLSRIDPLNHRAQRELAAGHQRLGHALRGLGRHDEALEHAAHDLALSAALVEKLPINRLSAATWPPA